MSLDGATVLAGGGFLCWELNGVADRVMEACDPNDIEYVAAWSFHQAIAEIAQNNVKMGVGNVDSGEVDLPLFARQLRFNLEDSSWAKVLIEFESENPGF
ncbi:hypothetical protein K9B35_19210 [Sphingomonas sp. R647]|uniref:hypothetical protein n=1 Tax=Sphingomonas sp. R647 TaxID=2875233 RepID=UPI001CD702E8|nr:hypothetical protein [Sphingomonas sp. R647]MCA1200101.1 hypothetical protein [Sphingomonas sp. R647]